MYFGFGPSLATSVGCVGVPDYTGAVRPTDDDVGVWINGAAMGPPDQTNTHGRLG